MYFRSFLKIFKSQLPSLMIYLGIFLGIAVINMQVSESKNSTGFLSESVEVAIIDKDNSDLSKGLTKCINNNTTIKKIIENDQGMEDALFERVVEYIVIIPKGYEESMINGQTMQLESKKVPDAYSAVFTENVINQYISTFLIYNSEYSSSLSAKEIIEMTNNSMENSANIEYKGTNNKSTDFITSCFNFGAYIILACVILGVAQILSIFFEKNISDRIDIAPQSNFLKNMILVVYSLFYMLIVIIINIVIYLCMFRGKLLDNINILRFLNMICLALVAAAIGFLISILIKSKGGRTAAINTIALGLSFISGAFVPIEYLSSGIVKVVSFLPVYWYIKANEYISEMSNSGIVNKASELFECMGIQILFFVALISIGMVAKKRRTRQIV